MRKLVASLIHTAQRLVYNLDRPGPQETSATLARNKAHTGISSDANEGSAPLRSNRVKYLHPGSLGSLCYTAQQVVLF